MNREYIQKNEPNRRLRLLLAAGNGRDRAGCGAACCFRDAGFEVVYLNGLLSPEQIVAAAIQESVDLIGVYNSENGSSFRVRITALLGERCADTVSVIDFGLFTPT